MASSSTLHLASTSAANALLAHDPLALLIGMLLDQQVPMEKAFTSPAVLRDRLGGSLDAALLADYDAAALEALFREPPALHRFPAAMAKRVQQLARVLVERYDGDAAALWRGVPDGAELVRRVAALPGFGPQKAQIFVALLGKQLGVRPPGWREATGEFGADGSFRSVADVTDADSLTKVREYKQLLKRQAKTGSGA
jgi:uncharacterized HhH-GPD family protein